MTHSQRDPGNPSRGFAFLGNFLFDIKKFGGMLFPMSRIHSYLAQQYAASSRLSSDCLVLLTP